ncbi:MAG: Dam family site-specific DNA-(adenine-N6)-methyltransferase [Cytophagales bacterium]|nr:Dam family site-specific DNA-(adenine-N6)-methyltransferase [Cytophagales bacterium]MCA6369015.1 Dam family site-specific DNA-(adenine-N6)-methyltransferase [Cytophagales bacterium]MCA6371475.1 Dam family site-specific DNA-(adenine-N6)-methyltransferase [Cytophagales bacterium]MCA6377838.1 Dam family site-specific DNA-(adenine-N6)-methyltransferase [Cytophagales bacterium]MCA6385278.1 Dam family site-specific DNA-(adenine-N6)-methyltransferase [Cytophagales bacterium]
MKATKEIIEDKSKPFLRWAGGKNWLIKHLRESMLEFDFKNYHEPFLGGGSLFLFLKPQNDSYLSDLNPELIETYIMVRDNVERVISRMAKFKNNERFYYSIRDQDSKSRVNNAAKFIYLNQTSFNGIYRVNLQGVYNVPYGFRSKEFLDATNLRLVSEALQGVELNVSDFASSIKKVKKGDLVFLDPPYTVSHNNNGFIKYNQKLFSLEDQYRLAECVKFIRKKGAYYILTNAAHFKVLDIFGGIDKHIELSRVSLIGGINAKRDQVSEFLFTNVPNLI